MPAQKRDFVIRQDSLPMKVLRMDPERMTPYMRHLQARFPNHQWSVSERFPLNGSD